MTAARYWRVVGVETYAGGALELSELQLYGGGSRVDASATLSCSHTPTAGALANLKDNDAATTCRFDAAAVASGGFYLAWDFGSDTTVDGVRLGSGALQGEYARGLDLQYFTAGQWATLSRFQQFKWPGAGALAAAAAPPDPTYPYCSLLLNFNGANNSTLIADKSPAPKMASVFGNAKISTAQSKFGGASLALDGAASSYVQFPNNTDFAVGSGDFTIDAWVYPTSLVQYGNIAAYSNGVASNGNYGFSLMRSAAKWYFNVFVGNNQYGPVSSGVATLNQWQHIAAVRSGSNLLLFVDGALVNTTNIGAVTPNNPVGALLYVGVSSGGNYPFAGYIDDLIITKGVAKYTAAFTPPTSEAGGFGSALEGIALSARRPARVLVAASAAVPAPGTSGSTIQTARDVENGGVGRVYGTVKEKAAPSNTPRHRRVLLIDERSRLPVRETWSDPVTGAYSFDYVDATRKYTVISYDHLGAFRAVVADAQVPEVIA